MNILHIIKKTVAQTVSASYALDTEKNHAIDITLNTHAQKQQFGDLSSNVALILSKQLGKNPRAVAEDIINTLQSDFIERCEIAGPGFINIFLSPSAKNRLAQELLEQKEQFFAQQSTLPLRYNIEFVSANPTGPLHIGHGRGGIIGDVLGNITHFVGNPTTKEFYINDAGAQIYKLGHSFKARCLQELGKDAQVPEEGYQGDYLIDLARTCIATYGPSVETYSDEFFADYAKEHLLQKLQQTLSLYGITFDVWFSEKSLHTNAAVEKAIAILEKNGHLFTTEDGTLWFRSTTFGDDKDRVIKRSNGEYTYVASDIAYLLNKLDRGFERLVMILGQDHHSYVIRLKAVLQGLGKNPDILDVILYQLVTLKEDGEQLRMSKRAGRIVSLEDVITTIGTDVARFFYLNKKADAHLDFDISLALKRTDENPVYYIQYAYVRTGSILEKAHAHAELADISVDDAHNFDAEEFLLLKKIASLHELLATITRNYQVHMLTYYALELTQLFHSYYAGHRVIDLENREQSRRRLLVVHLVRTTLSTCLTLLGISRPEKM